MKKHIMALAALCIIAVFLIAPSAVSTANENGPKECNDKIDNDGDGYIDLADSGCSGKSDDDETNCGDNVCEGLETAANCQADCKEEFCGWSTYGRCNSDNQCVQDGCNGEVCRGFKEAPIITQCIIEPCTDAVAYGMECGCVNNQCQWHGA